MLFVVLGVGFFATGNVARAGAPTDKLTWQVRPTDNEVGTGRSNFGYTAEPGGSLTDSIDVTNGGDEPLVLDIYAADAYTPEGGGIDLLPAGDPSVDVGAWIDMSAGAITVEPGSTVTVPFTLTVPENATPGDHSGGIVTSISTDSGQFVVDRRLGNRMHVRVLGELDPQLEVSDVSVGFDSGLNPFQPGTATVSFTVANTGNVRLNGHPEIAVDSAFGLFGQRLRADDLGEILPGNERRYEVSVPDVWALSRVSADVAIEPFPTNPSDVEADVDYPTVSSGASTRAVNWGQPILLVLVVAAVLGVRRMRRSVRARGQARIDAAVEEALAEQLASVTAPEDVIP